MASNRTKSALKGSRPVRVGEIEALSERSGYLSAWREETTPDSVVLGGAFDLRRYADGLRVHVTSGVEMSNMTAEFTVGPALSIFVLLEGYVAFGVNGETWELGVDDSVNVEAGLIWSRAEDTAIERHTRKGRHVCKIGITLEPDWFDQLDLPLPSSLQEFRHRHLAQMQWCPSPRALRSARDIVRPPEPDGLQARLASQQRALQIVQEVFGLFDDLAPADHEAVGLDSRANEIRAFLDKTLDDDLSLEHIGKSLGMSVTVLQDRFRASFAMTVGEYRRQQRLARAMVVLRDQGASVTDAALVAGYSSPANFATAFSREFGYPPSQVRR